MNDKNKLNLLLGEGLCREVPLHYDHVHLQIDEPPQ